MTAVEELTNLFEQMHVEGAQRECASSVHLMQSFNVNGANSAQSIVAAIMTFGGIHAPLVETGALFNWLITKDVDQLRTAIVSILTRGKMTGFGSAFVKGEPDPIHSKMDEALKRLAPKQHFFLGEITTHLHEITRKSLWPNTAMYSAIYANVMNIDPVLLPGLAIEARISVWNYQMRANLSRIRTKPQ